jgi:hypothetical protein
MDVEKLYPSLKAEKVAKVVAEEYRASELKIEVDTMALGLYLAIMVGREVLVRMGLGEVTHRRKKGEEGPGRKIGITTAEVTQETVKEENKLFVPPERSPTQEEDREMVALALEIAIKVAMGNHLYSFNGSVRLQLQGGPIGNRLSGALAKVYMLWWCRAFQKALSAAMEGITYFFLYLLLFYVDDTNLAMEELEPGCRLVDGKVVVVEEEVEADRAIPGDRRTARVIQDIANSICETINMTIDCPSNHESGWMPLLDLQVRVAEDNSLDYKFYSKKVANPLLLMATSALPDRVKRNSLVQQAMTRLRNTRRTLLWDTVADILTEFCLRLKWSGYNATYRAEVIYSAVTGYEKLLAKVDKGERPLHRPREWEAKARRRPGSGQPTR